MTSLPKLKALSPADKELLRACVSGDVEAAQRALLSDARTSRPAPVPLIEAAGYGHEAVVRLLLAHAADASACEEPSGDTALHAAARRGRDHLIDVLVDAKIDVDITNHAGLTPLMKAVDAAVDAGTEACVCTVRRLLARGGNPNAISASGATVLSWLACSADGEAAWQNLDALLEAGARVEDSGALSSACMSARIPVAIVERLLDAGCPVDERADGGCTPLWLAARANQIEYVELLLSRGADPNARIKDGPSVYEVARPRGDLKLLSLLRDAGAAQESKRTEVASPSSVDPYRVGATVKHPKFGPGRVTSSEGAGPERKVTVAFAEGSRSLLAKFLTTSDPLV